MKLNFSQYDETKTTKEQLAMERMQKRAKLGKSVNGNYAIGFGSQLWQYPEVPGDFYTPANVSVEYDTVPNFDRRYRTLLQRAANNQ